MRQLERSAENLPFADRFLRLGSASDEDVVAVKDQADRAMYHHKKRAEGAGGGDCAGVILIGGCKRRIEYKYATISFTVNLFFLIQHGIYANKHAKESTINLREIFKG